ncbi:MAG: DUF4349 domain-containing protein [Nanoarchaeota archaeon]|nr:DUF4349 domain-containing protein [Nanoarchaeota archaeon]
MTIKNQIEKVKDNWLIALLIIVLVGIPFFGGSSSLTRMAAPMMEMADQAAFGGGYAKVVSSRYMPVDEDFAPEVEERVITKSASMSTEVERGIFSEAETKAKSIIKSSDSFLLNENVNSYETGRRSYKRGIYQIKIETEKYDSVISQLKDIGEVKSFNENANDITGAYTDLNADLIAEKERLARYERMYSEAKEVGDKIELNDRIFNQQRSINYLEDRIENMDNRVSYSTVYFTLNEKRSEYVNVVFVKISELVKAFVGSINFVLKTIFILTPWAWAIGILVLIAKLFRKKKK